MKNIALVVIDLQKGIVAMDTAPYTSRTVIDNSVRLIRAFREIHAPVFLVHVDFLWGESPSTFRYAPLRWESSTVMGRLRPWARTSNYRISPSQSDSGEHSMGQSSISSWDVEISIPSFSVGLRRVLESRAPPEMPMNSDTIRYFQRMLWRHEVRRNIIRPSTIYSHGLDKWGVQRKFCISLKDSSSMQYRSTLPIPLIV